MLLDDPRLYSKQVAGVAVTGDEKKVLLGEPGGKAAAALSGARPGRQALTGGLQSSHRVASVEAGR